MGWGVKEVDERGKGREGICDQVSGRQKPDHWICTNWRGELTGDG